MKLVLPDHYFSSFLDVPFEHILGPGWTAIIDADNTLLPLDATTLSDNVRQRLLELRALGIFSQLCVLSNTILPKREARVERIAHSVGAHAVSCNFFRRKPRPWGYLQAMDKMGSCPESTVMIGDQLRTDVVGAAALGIKTILVKPLGADHWYTALRRRHERRILRGITPSNGTGLKV